MKVRARINVSPILDLCDEVTGVEFEIVATEFNGVDNSAVYCESIEDVIDLLRALRAERVRLKQEAFLAAGAPLEYAVNELCPKCGVVLPCFAHQIQHPRAAGVRAPQDPPEAK